MTDEIVNEETGEVTEVEAKPKRAPKAAVVPYEASSADQMFMSTSGFELIQRWGRMLAASAMVPDYLKDQPADCAMIVTQAMQWGLNPMVVAQSCYVARGRVGYEGKIIAGLVNNGLSRKLNYKFSGEGKTLKVVVDGIMKGESEERTVEGTWGEWSNDRNAAWKTMPKQMMAYRGMREWARRHNPGVISGIMSIDEVQDLESREETITIDQPVSHPDEMDNIVGETTVETPMPDVVDAEVVEKPKKRGRPKGSKNKKKEEPAAPQPTTDGQPSVDDLFDD
jgi:hypothetical protein